MRLFLSVKLSEIKGFGPKRLALLEQLNIHSCEDLLRYYPHEYLNYSETDSLKDAGDGDVVTLHVHILSDPSVFYLKGKSMVSVRASDATGKLTLRWMNQPYRAGQVACGMDCFVHGRLSRKKGTVLYNPQIEQTARGIVPLYSLPKGLTQSVFRAAVSEAMSCTPIAEVLPEELLERLHLLPVREAIRMIHFPAGRNELTQAKYRIQLEQAILYFLAVFSFREQAKLQNGYAFRTEGLLETFLSGIPFTPTDAQLRVMREVETDMQSPAPMNRLIQGDVGSGKTLIAEYALTIAAACGKQGVLLAPTEILAEQHYRTLQERFRDACVLYTGSLSQKEKKAVLERIENGSAILTVGTHALLSERVHFFDLGLVVTDEQHRFGVQQRARMEQKGIRPDVLVMSATPIPRTLALLLYSDLALSIVDEMPKGRKPVQTMFVPNTRRVAMYRYIAERVLHDERAFVVCPLIEETEDLERVSAVSVYQELQKLLPDCPIGLLHGQMKDDRKHFVMEAFRDGNYKILVSTTVIEVGVDIPRATYMVIEGAEHFGLATLHQLRGRVGRSDLQSYCYLLCSKLNAHAKERIRTMIQTNDGFELAQKDMELRGYGDLFGVRQSGEGELSGFIHSCTAEVLERASAAANEILRSPTLRNNELIRLATERYLSATQIARN